MAPTRCLLAPRMRLADEPMAAADDIFLRAQVGGDACMPIIYAAAASFPSSSRHDFGQPRRAHAVAPLPQMPITPTTSARRHSDATPPFTSKTSKISYERRCHRLLIDMT